MKFNVKYLHKGHKININFVRMILLYPHLKHKMPIDFLGWFLQYQMLGIKYACSMKKMVTIKNWKLKKKKLIVIKKIEENNLEQEKFLKI